MKSIVAGVVPISSSPIEDQVRPGIFKGFLPEGFLKWQPDIRVNRKPVYKLPMFPRILRKMIYLALQPDTWQQPAYILSTGNIASHRQLTAVIAGPWQQS